MLADKVFSLWKGLLELLVIIIFFLVPIFFGGLIGLYRRHCKRKILSGILDVNLNITKYHDVNSMLEKAVGLSKELYLPSKKRIYFKRIFLFIYVAGLLCVIALAELNYNVYVAKFSFIINISRMILIITPLSGVILGFLLGEELKFNKDEYLNIIKKIANIFLKFKKWEMLENFLFQNIHKDFNDNPDIQLIKIKLFLNTDKLEKAVELIKHHPYFQNDVSEFEIDFLKELSPHQSVVILQKLPQTSRREDLLIAYLKKLERSVERDSILIPLLVKKEKIDDILELIDQENLKKELDYISQFLPKDKKNDIFIYICCQCKNYDVLYDYVKSLSIIELQQTLDKSSSRHKDFLKDVLKKVADDEKENKNYIKAADYYSLLGKKCAFQHAYCLFKAEEFKKAIEVLKSIRYLETNNYKLFYLLGTALYKINNFEESINSFVHAFNIKPNKKLTKNICNIYLILAKKSSKENEWTKVIKYLNACLEYSSYLSDVPIENISKYLAIAYYNQALSLAYNNDTSESKYQAILNFLDKAINIINEDKYLLKKILILQALVLILQRQYSESLKKLVILNKKFKDDQQVIFHKMLVEAILQIRKGRDLDIYLPKLGDNYKYRAHLIKIATLLKEDRLLEAENELNSILKIFRKEGD